jgi:hypothetical protein
MQTEKIQIRCSSIGKLMTEPKLKADKEAGNLSETTKSYLVDVYVTEKYGREPEIHSKFIEKGLAAEDDSITLYSRQKKAFYKKNEDRLFNEYIKGTPDLYEGEAITKADVVIDIKTSWDVFSFFRTKAKDLNNDYYYQLQGYLALTGAHTAKLVYCLVDTPEILINDEKRRLMYKMGVATDLNEDYIQAAEELDKSMRFSDIPMSERVYEITIQRDEDVITRIYDKVKKARLYLAELETKLNG